MLKAGRLEALENLLKNLEEKKISINETFQFKEIRKSLNKNIEKLSSLLESLQNVVKNYEKNIQVVQPFFRWAQNNDFVILEIKYSHRHDSPGCLELEDLRVDISYDKILEFSGYCTLGDVPIKFELSLKLFGEINRLQSSWHASSVGKFLINLKKKPLGNSNNNNWPSLLRDGEAQPYNMQVWLEMQEQFDKKEEQESEADEQEEEELDYDELMAEKNKNKKKKRRPKYKFNVLNSDNYLHSHT